MIYLDHASASPLDPRVLEQMQPFFTEYFFNPSSAYFPALEVRQKYQQAKHDIARFIGTSSHNLVITSGATEANNLAFSILKQYQNVHLLVAKSEHDSILNTAKAYQDFATVQTIDLMSDGKINEQDLLQKITNRTVLISVSVANHETGVVQSISRIADIIEKVLLAREQEQNPLPLYLHTDASQALGLIDLKVNLLKVDMMTLSAAKISGIKGVGALYLRKNVALTPQSFGGGQEHGLRSGTENVAGVIGFATSLNLIQSKINSWRKKYQEFYDIFVSTLNQAKIKPKILVPRKKQLANFLSLSFDKLDAERIVFKLENQEIYVGTGAACAASKGLPSKGLMAMGLTKSEIAGSLRITFGQTNTIKDIKIAAQALLDTVNSEYDRIGKKPIESSKATVFLGMSGGVDSSVSALLLKQQGYQVVGVYMKNWSKDLPNMKCPWAEDLADAKRIATILDLDFKVYDFEKDYQAKVVEYMLSEFKAGRTPNPDIMCNQEIKFGLFYQKAIKEGADFIATGHYAKSKDGLLYNSKDQTKDQTYFLYRVPKTALTRTIFPVGDLEKSEVKALAKQHHLSVANKKESMGICFVGEVGIRDFLSEFISETKGDIIEIETNQKIGNHFGAHNYTLGQRHGLDLGGGLPFYVVGKDLAKNIVFVSKNLNHPNLFTKTLQLDHLYFRTQPPKDIKVRLRHQAELIPAQYENGTLYFSEPIKRPASGQSAVLYHQSECLGGGIIL